MKPLPTVILSLTAGFLGGTLAQTPWTANAQSNPGYRPGQGFTQRGNVHFDLNNNLIVQPQGLAFVDPAGREIARIGGEGQNAYLRLNDASGRPALVLIAGPQSRMTLNTATPGGLLDSRSADNDAGFRIAAAQNSTTLALRAAGQDLATIAADRTSGATFAFLNSRAQPMLTLTRQTNAPALTLNQDSGQKMAELTWAQNEGATLSLRGPDFADETRLQAKSLRFLRGGQTNLQFPPKESQN